jgi:hypothetical protein
MTERSPWMGVALLAAPTLCVLAIRFSITALENVLKEDLVAQAVIHGLALLLGIVMFMRYRVVADHEFHRSSAIKNLSKMYQMEDRGLWSKGDSALERLEMQARAPTKGRAGIRMQHRMSGSIADLNKERDELELKEGDARMDIDVHVEGVATIVDDALAGETAGTGDSGAVSARAEASAQRRLATELAKQERVRAKQERNAEKAALKAEKAEAKAAKSEAKAAAKAEAARAKKSAKAASRGTWATTEASTEWAGPATTPQTRSVTSCKECETVNNSDTAYCSNCGAFL